MASFGVGPNPYQTVESDILTQEKWDQVINNLVQSNYKRREDEYYANQAGQATYNDYNSINTQNPIPFPGVWQGEEPPAIISPYVDWDKGVWVVTKVDGEGNGYVKAVFSTKELADKYVEDNELDQYEYFDVTKMFLDGEVVNETEE